MNQNSIDPKRLRQQFIELLKLHFKNGLDDDFSNCVGH
jgi:hypothetical protein